mgnify:CR=1 FL=1
MQVTSRSQNSSDDTSQEIGKQTEGGSGAEPGETPPVAVPPVIPLPEDRAAALDELCRSLDGSDERVSRSITRIRLEKGLPWDTDPRVVADALVRAGHLPEVVRTITWDWALWTCGSEDSWPWMAQDLARARDLLKDSTSATRVLCALEHFPAVPQSMVPALAQVAVGRSEVNRELAQKLLAGFPEVGDLALEAVMSPVAHVRRAGAAWLAGLTIPDGIARLRAARAQEEDRLARANLLRTLQVYGDDVTAEALTPPKRRLKRPPVALDWFPFEALPEVRLADGTPLDPDIVRNWVLEAYKLKTPDGAGTIELYLRLLDAEDARELSAFVVECWVAHNREAAKGESLRNKGLLAFAVGMEGGRLAAAARSALSRHATWRAESETVLTAVAANPSAEALQVIVSAAAQHRLPQVRGFADLLTRAVAAERGWSEAELGDRSIPTAGFGDDGLLHLSYGEREFLGRLTPELTIVLTDSDGRARKSLPAARKSEDGELVAHTRHRLTFARKEAAAVLKVQSRRLYEAMCVGRSWPVPLWRELFADHPLARHLAARLVWMVRCQDESVRSVESEADGGAPQTWAFRLTEDGQLLGADDAVLELPPDAVVGLAHGTLLTEAEMSAWQEHLVDYEVAPLFDQFSARVPQVDKGQRGIDDGAGRRVVARDLRKRAKARGYEPDSNIHWYSTFLKDFPVIGLCSVIDFDGVDVWSEDQVVTTGPLSLVAGRRAMPLGQVPPVLLAECYADYRAIVAPPG